ncbi:MAG: carbamoyltransferase HypF, partial [Thermoanaerobaculia bacterium]
PEEVPAETILELDWRPLVEAVLQDSRRGVEAGMIAARFHNSLVGAIVAVARAIGESRVALTGGCFQNRLLTERAARRLREAGFEVLLHRKVPPNDGGISLGQVAVAAARLSQESLATT